MPVTDPCILFPIRFATANPVLRIKSSVTTEDVTLTIATDTDYYVSGDGTATDLVKILEDALNTNSDADVYTVSLTERNVVSILFGSPPGTLFWSHVNTTVDPTLFGFTAADIVDYEEVFATNVSKGVWFASNSAAGSDVRPYHNAARDKPRIRPVQTIAISGKSRQYLLEGLSGDARERILEWSVLKPPRIYTSQALATEPYNALEYNLVDLLGADGRTIRVYDDRTVRTASSYGNYAIQAREWDEYITRLAGELLELYDVRLPLLEVV